jgi:hypothetical protein
MCSRCSVSVCSQVVAASSLVFSAGAGLGAGRVSLCCSLLFLLKDFCFYLRFGLQICSRVSVLGTSTSARTLCLALGISRLDFCSCAVIFPTAARFSFVDLGARVLLLQDPILTQLICFPTSHCSACRQEIFPFRSARSLPPFFDSNGESRPRAPEFVRSGACARDLVP